MRRPRPHPTLASLTLLALCASLAQAAPSSTTFAPTLTVHNTALLLNGSGTRYRAVFKLYDMALYTTSRVSSSAELLALPGPKRLNFTAVREIPGTDLGLAFIKGLQANAPREQVQRHAASSTRLIEIFSGKSKLLPGETFAMEFQPGKGTQFYIQGQPQGAPVGDDEFFTLVLMIWFGPSAVDPLLRDALLGQAARPAF